MGLAGVVFVLRIGTCFEMPELSASIILDKLSESGGPGDGVHNILVPKVRVVSRERKRPQNTLFFLVQ